MNYAKHGIRSKEKLIYIFIINTLNTKCERRLYFKFQRFNMKCVRFMKAHGFPQYSCRADRNVNNAHAEAATPQFIPHTPAWQALGGSVCTVGEKRGRGEDIEQDCVGLVKLACSSA